MGAEGRSDIIGRMLDAGGAAAQGRGRSRAGWMLASGRCGNAGGMHCCCTRWGKGACAVAERVEYAHHMGDRFGGGFDAGMFAFHVLKQGERLAQ